ncbi:MAG: hypothetical protein Q8N18_17265 [Opitutaceae bacterium]|nr:hypothetical protein [Opitutaceae bacterium]
MNHALSISLLVFLASDICAQTLTPRTLAPLGLLRLKDDPKPGEAAKLTATKFTIDDLAANAAPGAALGKKDDVDVLTLNAGREWSRNLRGSPRDVTFVSFQLHASAGTIVDIAGARLGITASVVDRSLQLMYDDSTTGLLQWKSFNLHLGSGRYEGQTMAALTTLTVRIDPTTGTWDLYSGSRLLADRLPLIDSKKNDRRFVLRAGSEGAWLTGLVFADENPLYEDANANGIDDRFELQTRGTLLPANAPLELQKAIAQEWKTAQRKKAPPALHVQRPRPDSK